MPGVREMQEDGSVVRYMSAAIGFRVEEARQKGDEEEESHLVLVFASTISIPSLIKLFLVKLF